MGGFEIYKVGNEMWTDPQSPRNRPKGWIQRPCSRHKQRFELECVECKRQPVEEVLAIASEGRVFTIESIARVCHEANRAYCESIGDRSQAPWEEAPEWQRSSARVGVDFHISHLDRGEKASPDASHNSWLEQKRADGWTYGAVKDPSKKQHPCFVPYADLPLAQRRKDYLFAAIVEALYTAK